MHADWLAKLRCPADACRGRLGVALDPPTAPDERAQWIRCRTCGVAYPVWGEIPLLVPSIAHYVAGYREPLLASLAEADLVSPAVVAAAQHLAAIAGPAEALRFGDDWTASEEAGRLPVWPVGAGVEGIDGAVAHELSCGGGRAPEALLLARLGARLSTELVEVGPGAGTLSARLAWTTRRLVVADLSLRAVLKARSRARSEGAPAEVEGLVADAAALPFAPGSLAGIAAMNVIDLLDDPEDFLASGYRALRRGGRLWLVTPAPDALGATGRPLAELCEEVGLSPEVLADRIPWLRIHTARHVEVYFTQLIEARRGS